MKQNTSSKSPVLTLTALTVLLAFSLGVQAHPYASGVTNDNGTIRFIMNEAGANVDVVFENNTTNALGVLPRGAASFALGSHTSFRIICSKVGNGTPSLISVDADQYSIWANPRGVAVNKNPKSPAFGRIYAGSAGQGGYAYGTLGFKPKGLYAMNADFTEALGRGTNAAAQATFAGSGVDGPWRMRVAPDDTLLVVDWSTAAAALWQFAPDFSNSNLVLAVIGQNEGVAAGIHGDIFGTPLMTGSLAEGNLVLWTAEGRLSAPATANLGPGTAPGDYNCVFRYDIGAGPLPWTNAPNYAYTMGLSGIPGLRTEVDIAKDGKIIVGFGRANLSNPNIQILNPAGDTLLYSGGITPPANSTVTSDPWNGINGSGTQGGTYAGVRVSPDGRYLASVDINNGVTLASLVNGLPDDSSIFRIQNTPSTGNSRGMDWDAANNIYVASSGQLLVRAYSLGLSTVCITSNDWTGTNGAFNMILPSLTATVDATQPLASQNYINSTPAGTPIPGVFRISLDKGTLTEPVTVNFTRTGTATYPAHYTINTNETPNGVLIGENSVTFPVGTAPGGNWSVDVKITPTALPVSTNTLTVVVQVTGGATYLAGSPSRDVLAIQNTGPQLLLLAAAPAAPSAGGTSATMYRGVTNDYAKFLITRLGDTNGPGNSAGNVTARPFTVTNVTYLGTAVYPLDYTARAQRLDPAGDGALVPPADGPTAILVNPGDTAVVCAVGNPVRHTNLSARPANLTIIVNLTNAATGTNLTSQEGLPYSASTATTTLTLVDNTIGPEVVLWSNPLTNAADSVNWTLTFAATNFGAGHLPLVVRNYPNDFFTIPNGGTNDFLVRFGEDISNDGIPPSPVMAANGWTKALKMTVNKNSFAQAAVNVYPQGKRFEGNYALRFNMYLSLYQFGMNNPNIGAAAREFALFGVNHHGTNCNWRTAAPLPAGSGMAPINSDGLWFAIDAGAGSTTPADFDAFRPLAVPNAGVAADVVSASAISRNGVFKHPPFEAMNVTSPTVANPGGGEPVNKWVDVSVEITAQTNVSLYVNGTKVLTPFSLTNTLGGASAYTNGTIMLGYLDPDPSVSDGSAFVYFSNVRVVALSPSILVQAGVTNSLSRNVIVPQFSSLTFTSAVSLATAPITNVWYTGAFTTAQSNGLPQTVLQSNWVNAASMSSTYTRMFNSAADGANYMTVFSDPAGSVTSLVVQVEVVLGPTNKTYLPGTTSNLLVAAAGPVAPTAYRWYFNPNNDFATATRLANDTHYAGTTTNNLWLTNITAADQGYYWCAVTNAAGGLITPPAFLTVPSTATPPLITSVSASGADTILSFTSTNAADTTSSFMLQSAGVVTGPYTNNSTATFSGTYPAFQVTAPKVGDTMFYRLLHN